LVAHDAIPFSICSCRLVSNADDGTYELVGPNVQGNPEMFISNVLIRHGQYHLPDCPRDFDGIREYLSQANIEGIVWHHSDGRMVKIKAKDFGIKRADCD